MSEQHLFVYGTLRPGEKNAGLLEQFDGRWREAKIAGRLYPDGNQDTYGYPVVDLREDGEVQGWVFSSAALVGFWPQLDEFEIGYQRLSTDARLNEGERLSVFVYAAKQSE